MSSAAMGAALFVAATPARADDFGPGPYGIGGPGTGNAVADTSERGPGPGDAYSYGYGYPDNGYPDYAPYPSDGNAGPGPYGIGGPGTGKTVAYP
jgi:hypothetical protein